MTLSAALLDVAEQIVVMVVDALIAILRIVCPMEPIPQHPHYLPTVMFGLHGREGDLGVTILRNGSFTQMVHGVEPDMVMNMRLCQNAITPAYLTWS